MLIKASTAYPFKATVPGVSTHVYRPYTYTQIHGKQGQPLRRGGPGQSNNTFHLQTHIQNRAGEDS
jgi:hypothetical protein